MWIVRLVQLGLLAVLIGRCGPFLTKLTGGNLSSYMSKLEAAGYLDIREEFAGKIPRTLLCLTGKGRKAFQTYRQDMIQVLEDLAD
jgi:DNA-binding PadR family transcriptional regulator